MRSEGWGPNPIGLVAFLEKEVKKIFLSLSIMWGKPRREISPEFNHASTPILDFQPPELWENKCLLRKPPSLWYFVKEAWADQDAASTA